MIKIMVGDCASTMKEIDSGSIHCCVTSPPYFGLRDYGHDAQIGLEKTPEEFVSKLVDIFREVKRVLRDDGTLWLNIGDSYNGSGGQGTKPNIMSKEAAQGRAVLHRGAACSAIACCLPLAVPVDAGCACY